jgi:hypothetical protein
VAPVLTTAVGRIRFAVGDHDDAALLLEGGLDQYASLLAQQGGDEVAAYRAVAGALAGFYGAQPVRISGGKSVDYSDRVPTWLAMAQGKTPYPFAADGSALPSTTPGRAAIGTLTAGATAAAKLR